MGPHTVYSHWRQSSRVCSCQFHRREGPRLFAVGPNNGIILSSQPIPFHSAQLTLSTPPGSPPKQSRICSRMLAQRHFRPHRSPATGGRLFAQPGANHLSFGHLGGILRARKVVFQWWQSAFSALETPSESSERAVHTMRQK